MTLKFIRLKLQLQEDFKSGLLSNNIPLDGCHRKLLLPYMTRKSFSSFPLKIIHFLMIYFFHQFFSRKIMAICMHLCIKVAIALDVSNNLRRIHLDTKDDFNLLRLIDKITVTKTYNNP